MQMSKKQLEQMLAKGARLKSAQDRAPGRAEPSKTPQPALVKSSDSGKVSVPDDALRDQQLDRMMSLVEQLGSLSAAQFGRVEALIAHLTDRPTPLAPQKPNPCTLKIRRDSRGYIDAIDVLPKE